MSFLYKKSRLYFIFKDKCLHFLNLKRTRNNLNKKLLGYLIDFFLAFEPNELLIQIKKKIVHSKSHTDLLIYDSEIIRIFYTA